MPIIYEVMNRCVLITWNINVSEVLGRCACVRVRAWLHTHFMDSICAPGTHWDLQTEWPSQHCGSVGGHVVQVLGLLAAVCIVSCENYMRLDHPHLEREWWQEKLQLQPISLLAVASLNYWHRWM